MGRFKKLKKQKYKKKKVERFENEYYEGVLKVTRF